MNWLLLEAKDRIGPGRYRVSDARLVQLREVLKAQPGASLKVGLLNGPHGLATLTRIAPDVADLELGFSEHDPVPPRSELHVILGMPRPKVLKRLLSDLVGLGAGRISLIRSWRVEKAYLKSPLLRPEAQKAMLMTGLMQAGLTHLPEVEIYPLFMPWIAEAKRLSGPKIAFHPHASTDLTELLLPPEGPIHLAIGPEGGFIARELASLEAAGFVLAHSDREILRVETAVAVLTGQVRLLRRLASRAKTGSLA